MPGRLGHRKSQTPTAVGLLARRRSAHDSSRRRGSSRLRRVVRGHAVDQARKLGRLVLLDPDWFDGQSQRPQPEPRWHRLELLEASMAMLSPGERQILLWRYSEGLGCVEIAALLGVSLRSAKRKLADASQLVKAGLKKVEKSWHDLTGSNV